MSTTTLLTKRAEAGIAVSALYFSILGLALSPAIAQEPSKKTIVTVNAPVEVPGMVLTPGTYVFKLLNVTANRNVVEILDKDEKHLLTTILAIPDYRLMPSDKPVISFEERPSGTPEAIKAWFYPGDNYGIEFVYPHKRAVQLAKRTNQNVLSMRDEMTKNMATQSQSASDSEVKELQNTEVSGVNPAGERVEFTVVVATAPVN